jgi:hypothetical protein
MAPIFKKWASDNDMADPDNSHVRFFLVDADKVLTANTSGYNAIKPAPTYNEEAELEYLQSVLEFAKGRSRPTFLFYLNARAAANLAGAPFLSQPAKPANGDQHASENNQKSAPALVVVDGIDLVSINLLLAAMTPPKNSSNNSSNSTNNNNVGGNMSHQHGDDGTLHADAGSNPSSQSASRNPTPRGDRCIPSQKHYTSFPAKSTPTSLATTNYKPPQNVQKDFRFRFLVKEHQWIVGYENEYAHPLSLEENLLEIKKVCRKDSWLCLGVVDMEGDPEVFVSCAFVRARDFFASTTDEKNVARGPFNGKIFVYCRQGCSCGYVQGTNEIQLGPDDKAKKNGQTRVCWMLDGSGGARCGEKIMLNESTRFMKVILHTPY